SSSCDLMCLTATRNCRRRSTAMNSPRRPARRSKWSGVRSGSSFLEKLTRRRGGAEEKGRKAFRSFLFSSSPPSEFFLSEPVNLHHRRAVRGAVGRHGGCDDDGFAAHR